MVRTNALRVEEDQAVATAPVDLKSMVASTMRSSRAPALRTPVRLTVSSSPHCWCYQRSSLRGAWNHGKQGLTQAGPRPVRVPVRAHPLRERDQRTISIGSPVKVALKIHFVFNSHDGQ